MAHDKEIYARLDGGETPSVKDSVWDFLARAAADNADKVAVISRGQPSNLLTAVVGEGTNVSSDGVTWLYSQLVQGTLNIATVLEGEGVRPYPVLLAFLPPVRAEWALLWWVANYLKLTLVTIDKRALEPARVDGLKFYLRFLGPETVVVHDSAGAGPVDKACEELQLSIKSKVTFGPMLSVLQTWKAM